MARLVGVSVRFRFRVHRHHHEAAMAHAALGDHVIGQMAHMFRLAIDIDQRGNSVPGLLRSFRRLTHAGAREIADRL